jgi:hypothetical protein
MWRALPALLLLACGPARDTSAFGPSGFFTITQFSAVSKLQLDAKHIYYLEDGQLSRVPKAGGTGAPLDTTTVRDFAATVGHVYSALAGAVMHFTVDEKAMLGKGVQIGSGAAVIAADSHGVTWLECGRLTHARPDGSDQSTTPYSGECTPGEVKLVLDASTAYVQNKTGLWWASRSGGTMHAFGSRTCGQLAAAGGWLYCSTDAGLIRINPLTSRSEDVLTGEVRAFALSASTVYVALGQDLVASPRNTSNMAVYGTQSAISVLAVDDGAVYLVNTDKGLGRLLSTAL